MFSLSYTVCLTGAWVMPPAVLLTPSPKESTSSFKDVSCVWKVWSSTWPLNAISSPNNNSNEQSEQSRHRWQQACVTRCTWQKGQKKKNKQTTCQSGMTSLLLLKEEMQVKRIPLTMYVMSGSVTLTCSGWSWPQPTTTARGSSGFSRGW